MNLYIKVPGREWPAQDGDIKEMLLGNRKAKIPAGGFPVVKLQGIAVWAEPRTPGKFRLRVMAECPVCRKEVAAGRLAQHSKIHSKENTHA